MSDLPNIHGPLTLAIDLETIDPNLKDRGPGAMRRDGRVIGIALGLPGEAGRYYPLDGPEEDLNEHPFPEVTIRYFQDLLKRPDITVVGANLLYDLLWLRTLEIECAGPLEDVQLAEQLINENLPTYSLESLSQRYLGRGKLGAELEQYAAERGWKSHWPHLAEMPIRLVGRYAAVDAANTLGVREKQQKVLLDQNLTGIYGLECELIRVVLDMTWRGIRIDEAKCHQVLEHCRRERDRHIEKMQDIAGSMWEIDIWSNPSIGDVAKYLGYPIGVSEKDGDSFDKEFLNKHKGEIPFYASLLEARKHDRIGEIFINEKIINMAQGGRIYPTWRQGRGDRYVSGGGGGDGLKGTRSGRFSSEAPALQQFPARHGELANLVRSCILPEEGEQWMSSDFCYSGDTEILTPRGFVCLPEVVSNREAVMQFHPDSSLTEVMPSRHLVRTYSGRMFHLWGRQQDILVTEDHPMIVYRPYEGDIARVSVEEFIRKHKTTDRILNAGYFEGTIHLDERLIRLAVAVQADGIIKRTPRFEVNSVGFKLKKSRKISRLVALLEDLKLPYTASKIPSWPGFIRIYVSGTQLPVELNHMLGPGLKVWDRAYLLSLTVDNRRTLLKELPHWDGSLTSLNSGVYCTSVSENVDTLQEIAAISGMRSTTGVKDLTKAEWSRKQQYTVQLSFAKDRTYVKNSDHAFVDVSNEKVYCVTVPSGMVVLRRNRRVFVGSNCSQEPRITVHYGTLINDKSADLVAAAYRADPRTDYHQKVRDMVEEVSGVCILRKQAKTLNLGLAYGLGKKKLMAALEVDPVTAENILEAYHSSVPYVRKLQKLTTTKAEKVGEIRTLLGRKRSFSLFWRVPYQKGDKPLPFDEAKRAWPNSRLERVGAYKALNALIQGSAADQNKKAMVLCHNAGLKMLATVHDELCFSVSSEAEIRKAIEIMENAVELAVPMKVDVEVGPSWGELKEFEQ